MKIRFGSAAEFDEFKSVLRTRLDTHSPREVSKPEFKRAAVMMLFMNKGGEAHVLLTKRTDKVATHKGQIAFPGGGYDEEDGDILRTALRETQEEVGIPADDIELLGQFDDFISIAGFHVVTYVGAIRHPYAYTINRDEIDEYIEVPLSLFVDRKFEKVQQLEYEGRSFNVYHYLYHGFEIWGLTARILTDFAAKIINECSG
jgi:8-oxo-dGTP pyrophosphatase MutT (NUDIX family)